MIIGDALLIFCLRGLYHSANVKNYFQLRHSRLLRLGISLLLDSSHQQVFIARKISRLSLALMWLNRQKYRKEATS